MLIVSDNVHLLDNKNVYAKQTDCIIVKICLTQGYMTALTDTGHSLNKSTQLLIK